MTENSNYATNVTQGKPFIERLAFFCVNREMQYAIAKMRYKTQNALILYEYQVLRHLDR